MDNMTVARTIRSQLGSSFTVMTGAKDFLAIDRGLQLTLSANDTRAWGGKRINRVRIILDPSDTYTVEFHYVARSKGAFVDKMVAKHSDVYCDDLQGIFTAETGLLCRLGQPVPPRA